MRRTISCNSFGDRIQDEDSISERKIEGNGSVFIEGKNPDLSAYCLGTDNEELISGSPTLCSFCNQRMTGVIKRCFYLKKQMRRDTIPSCYFQRFCQGSIHHSCDIIEIT